MMKWVTPKRCRPANSSTRASDSESEAGKGRSTVAVISISPGSRPAASAEARTMSRRAVQASGPPAIEPFHMSARRPASGSPYRSPLAPMQIRGGGSGRGGAAASSMAKCWPAKLGWSSVHMRRQISSVSSSWAKRTDGLGKS